MKYLLLTLTALTFTMNVPALAGHGEESSTQAHADHETFKSDVDVNVNGLVCDFCARALEKVFSKREEVNSINVDLSKNLVAIDLKDGSNIEDAEITKLITDSGYNVVDIKRPAETTTGESQ